MSLPVEERGINDWANYPSQRANSLDLPADMKPSEWLAAIQAGLPVVRTPAVDVDDGAETTGPRGKRVGLRKSDYFS